MKRREKMMPHKKRRLILGITLLAILLFPIRIGSNGGPIEYRALIYTVHDYNRIGDGDRLWAGIQINIFNRTIIDTVRIVEEGP